MKKVLMLTVLFVLANAVVFSQHVLFEEYDLDNGLHVILHQDKTAPLVVTSVMYHVGAKDENPERTGFAHFFEHLLFEGTENIARGEWDLLVGGNGGMNNANTTDDRTYYFELFPSNNLQMALWMEAERMFHPVINQIGVDIQREVVKEEKRKNYDNRPYGKIWNAVKINMFKQHPYRWMTIGSMEHLNAATLDEFKAFFKKFYIPNNAVLVVAGDFDTANAKKWIDDYFKDIPKGTPIVREAYTEAPIVSEIRTTYEDPNIQIPALITAYRTPSMKVRDAYVLDMISSILSGGKSSRLYSKLVDKEKTALEVAAFNNSEEDYGAYIIFGLPMTGKTSDDILKGIDEEVVRLQTELISEKEYQKLQNKFENAFVRNNATVDAVADNLATYYMLYKDVNLINTEIDLYRSITREEIRDVANRYLKSNQRVVIDYVAKNN
ncbi:MAG: insulinase family protein [Prevotella sp.]|jgi:predicted Zn-dependent peptidase|nr:insulinase family protein [Prevotella sp.]